MRLPQYVDPRKLAIKEARFDSPVATKGMARLHAAVDAAAEELKVSLAFSMDESRNVVLEGEFSVDVTRHCQRCLQDVYEKLSGNVLLGVVWSEERAQVLPKRYDPWLIEGDSANIYDLLEDEILLSLPFVAYHDKDACPSDGSYSTGEFEEESQNPFGVLAALKK